MNTPQKWKRWHKITLGIVGAFVLLMIIAINTDPGEETSNEGTKVKAMTAADSATARKELIEKQFSAWDGSHKKLEKMVKSNLNDPGSYEHIETKYWERDSFITVRLNYTAKNAFGGRVRGSALADFYLNGGLKEVKELE